MPAITIGLLGYGTVGSAVHRLLRESASAIERVTGSPVDGGRGARPRPRRAHPRRRPDCCTTDFARLRDDPDDHRSWPR